jgi:hypothetical protein
MMDDEWWFKFNLIFCFSGSSSAVGHASPGDPRHNVDYDSGPMQKRSRLTEGWAS